jgi:hypothetical protein
MAASDANAAVRSSISFHQNFAFVQQSNYGAFIVDGACRGRQYSQLFKVASEMTFECRCGLAPNLDVSWLVDNFFNRRVPIGAVGPFKLHVDHVVAGCPRLVQLKNVFVLGVDVECCLHERVFVTYRVEHWIKQRTEAVDLIWPHM